MNKALTTLALALGLIQPTEDKITSNLQKSLLEIEQEVKSKGMGENLGAEAKKIAQIFKTNQDQDIASVIEKLKTIDGDFLRNCFLEGFTRDYEETIKTTINKADDSTQHSMLTAALENITRQQKYSPTQLATIKNLIDTLPNNQLAGLDLTVVSLASNLPEIFEYLFKKNNFKELVQKILESDDAKKFPLWETIKSLKKAEDENTQNKYIKITETILQHLDPILVDLNTLFSLVQGNKIGNNQQKINNLMINIIKKRPKNLTMPSDYRKNDITYSLPQIILFLTQTIDWNNNNSKLLFKAILDTYKDYYQNPSLPEPKFKLTQDLLKTLNFPDKTKQEKNLAIGNEYTPKEFFKEIELEKYL